MAHFVNNKVLTAAMTDWVNAYHRAPENDKPPIPEEIGEAAYMIADRLSRKSNFTYYTFKLDMIGDGLLAFVSYAKNFNPAKCGVGGAFAYITTIITNAFIRHILQERKLTYTKAKLFRELAIGDQGHLEESGDEIIATFEAALAVKAAKVKANNQKHKKDKLLKRIAA